MSERGVFAVDRGVFQHPILIGEPYTRMQAFIWLISEAAWKPHRKAIGSKDILLARGQTAHSLRFMAKAWGWTEPKVRRFLGRLKADAMIDAETDAGVTVITLCNYERYQRVSLPGDAATDAPCDAAATQSRRRLEDKEYKEDKVPPSANAVGARSATKSKQSRKPLGRPSYSPLFESEFWPRYPKTANNSKAEAFAVFDRLSAEDQQLAVAGLSGFSAYCQRERDWYKPCHAAVYLRKRRFDEYAGSSAAKPLINAEERERGQRSMAAKFFKGQWADNWGKPPGDPDCPIPVGVVAEVAEQLGATWPA